MPTKAATSKSFLEDIVGGFNEQDAFMKATQSTVRGGSVGADFFNIGHSLGQGIGPGVAGIAAGIGGLITGEGGRSFKEFGRDFNTGMTQAKDDVTAQAMGLSGGEELRAKRKTIKEVRAAQSKFVDDGSFENRIALAKEVAKIAQRNGDAEAVSRSMEQITLLEKEEAEFKKLDAESKEAVREENIAAEVGFEARAVGDAPSVKGKAVRINKGVNAGKYTLVRPGKEDEVVDGKDLIAPGITSAAVTKRPLAQDTLQGLVRANGATSGQIAKMRGQMNSFQENSVIISNIADNLLSANDPQGLLAQSGKAAINADKTISFAESISSVFTDPRIPQSKITYGDKPVTAQKQYELATDQGLLTRFLKTVSGEELVSLDDYLPAAIRGNAIAAEQYWANVMELAYLDARIMEPSNRGLSDNDIINALKRIGADTANPLSFATRQLEVIDTKLLPQLQNLGSDFTNFGSTMFSERDIVDSVYNPARRLAIRETLTATRNKLEAVLAQGRRGEESPEADTARANGLSDDDAALGDDALAQEIAALEEQAKIREEEE